MFLFLGNLRIYLYILILKKIMKKDKNLIEQNKNKKQNQMKQRNLKRNI